MDLEKIIIKNCLYGIIIFCGVCNISSERRSGIYVDNGNQQSSIEYWLSPEEEANFEKDMGKLLGIKYNSNINEGTLNKEKSAPKFMLNVYKNYVEEKSDKSNEFNLMNRDLKKISQSDAIISFMAQKPRKGPGEKPDRVKRMWFDVSEVANDDDIMMDADLKLYMNPDVKKNIENLKNSDNFTIIVERVLPTDDGQQNFHVVDSMTISPNYRGWITLNVTESLHFWMHNLKKNRGLRVTVTHGDNLKRFQPEKIGIVGFDGKPAIQPFMAGFYKNTGKREIQFRIDEIAKKYKRSINDQYSSLDTFKSLVKKFDHKKGKNSCTRNKWYLSFKSLKWQDWILEPEGYDAYFCSGECDNVLGYTDGTTNHAFVQSLLHLRHPEEVPKTCCAPTKLSDLPVIFFQNENNVVYRIYKHMAVEDCGCQ